VLLALYIIEFEIHLQFLSKKNVHQFVFVDISMVDMIVKVA